MTTNRLAKSETQLPRMSAQEVCEHQNMHVREIGRGHEIEWRVENGRPVLDWIREPRTRQIPQYRQPYADHD